MKYKRIAASIVAFVVTYFVFRVSGSHKCYEGTPPVMLAYIAGLIAAGIPWFFKEKKWMRGAGYGLIIIVSMITVMSLAMSYHGEQITGNPEFSSGRLWHSFITGQLPRDKAKTEAFYEKRESRFQAATNSSEQDATMKPQP